MQTKPQSIYQLSIAIQDGVDCSPIQDFLDVIIDQAMKDYESNRPLSISEDVFALEPVLLDGALMVYLGGMAEYLAMLSNKPPPEWCEKEQYFSSVPIFLGREENKFALLSDTPSAFRRRLLFCGQVFYRLFSTLSLLEEETLSF